MPTKTPKIVAVASAADLDFRYGCTPAWWQLWKGMHEVGVDLIVTTVPRQGDRVAVVARRRRTRSTARRRRSRARATPSRGSRATSTCGAPRSSPDDTRADRAVREVDLALRDAALAQAPRVAARARARRRRRRRLHRPDVALPRHPDARCASASTCRSSSTTATCR